MRGGDTVAGKINVCSLGRGNSVIEVFEEGKESIKIPVTDFNLKSSADGTTELNITVKGDFTEFESSICLEQLKR